MNGAIVVGELAVASTGSLAVATSVNADALLTALISFGISLVTIVGGELIKYLVAFFKKKTQQLEEKKPEGKQEEKPKE